MLSSVLRNSSTAFFILRSLIYSLKQTPVFFLNNLAKYHIDIPSCLDILPSVGSAYEYCSSSTRRASLIRTSTKVTLGGSCKGCSERRSDLWQMRIIPLAVLIT